MSLDTFIVTRPNADKLGSDPLALVVAEFSGIVEGSIARKSVLHGWIPMKSVKGTSTLSSYAIGESTIGVVTPGVTPNGTTTAFSKINLTIDTLLYARATLPKLDVFQTSFDARSEIAKEHSKKIAKQYDQALFIQAAKAALSTTSPYATGGVPPGHVGGSQQTLALSADRADPAKLYDAIAKLFTKMEQKDVDVIADEVILVVNVQDYYTLLNSEHIINGQYITSSGEKLENQPIFKAFGVPVIKTNNLPTTNITSYPMNSVGNSNAYNGDFTKLVAIAFSSRALLAGETIPLNSDVYYDKISKSWYVDSDWAFGVTPNRPEWAGAILLP